MAWQLDGVKFALGPDHLPPPRTRLAGFGGYAASKSARRRPAGGPVDRGPGLRSGTLAYRVLAVADYPSMSDLIHKRLRWIVVMRHMRPWGHLGLLN